ncbi:THAP-type domain-containing protein [Aphis craccivora]|uniref:THAP-type domain-containing protein n=1 Tax=Aphis craccivora TaxID=307492 RepID=A0A6G0YUT0_APHCR|nr:THAP-type domain-containing protein [Aphis craccivora]
MVYSKCLCCGSLSKNNTDLSFHSFPKNSLRDQWLKSLGLANASKWDKLCSKHFDQKYYLDGYAKKSWYEMLYSRHDCNIHLKILIPMMPTIFSLFVLFKENTNIYEAPMTEYQHDSSNQSIDLHGFPVLSACCGFSNYIRVNDTLTPQYQSKRFGDFTEEDFSTPRRELRNFGCVQSTIKHLRQKNRCLVQTNKRLLHKVETLNDALKELNDKYLLSDYAINNLKQSYSEELKQLSGTLQYYSPQAYDYFREKLKNHLPHQHTLKRWYTAVINGQPGFTKESLDSIANNVKKQLVYCNLVIDEMSIRKYIEMNSQRNIYGFVNLGMAIDMDGDEIQEAKNALVFLAVGINGYWKLPIGYFLIDGLNGQERVNLLQKAIELLSDTGVKINSITFDGTSSELVPKVLQNSKGQPIRWNYFDMLYQLECEKGLRAGTKITIRHIKYTDEKMNPGFKNVDATVEFVTYMNNAFDILNSRLKFPIKPYNKPISEEKITQYKEFTNEFSSYVQGLSFVVEHKNDQPITTNILQSNRKTGFLG